MGIQKYWADKSGEPEKNGSVPWYVSWGFGPSLALVRNCPAKIVHMDQGVAVSEDTIDPRTVYITGEADTFFSVPAAIKFKGKRVNGWLDYDTGSGYFFRGQLK